MSGSTPYEILLEINNVLCKIKHEQMCGICRSTFSNPVSATCGHVFCKLGRAYRMSLRNSSISIPEDIAYAESQIPGTLVTSDSPMPCSGSARQFALPKLRLKRKRLYGAYINCKTPKMDRIVEENDCEENDTTPLEQDEQTMMDQPNVPDNDCKEDNAVSSQSVEVQCDAVSSQSVEVQCDAVNSQSVEVQCNLPDPAFECDDIQKSIPSLHEKYLCLSSDLRAIIEEMPRLKDLLVKNITVLYDMYGPKPCATSENHPAMDTPEKKCFSTQISFDDFPDDDDSVEVDA
ncbi:hypothetical protein KIN20_008295 [Parelaphostrongylus tenuis]|uniref:Zinc finger RING-type eukaryotic domain-containing protein n=1 Tax=Parelaphostrongylus tenuis TaxID=148309 RepID=A0AAD5M7T0_PARTN|nr:hypothetical protein KIN20_008295 [Parelaphostrongylus tenuis]